jgi:hypothetical protein
MAHALNKAGKPHIQFEPHIILFSEYTRNLSSWCDVWGIQWRIITDYGWDNYNQCSLKTRSVPYWTTSVFSLLWRMTKNHLRLHWTLLRLTCSSLYGSLYSLPVTIQNVCCLSSRKRAYRTVAYQWTSTAARGCGNVCLATSGLPLWLHYSGFQASCYNTIKCVVSMVPIIYRIWNRVNSITSRSFIFWLQYRNTIRHIHILNEHYAYYYSCMELHSALYLFANMADY